MLPKNTLLFLSCAILANVARAGVTGCGGGGSFATSDAHPDLSSQTLGSRSSKVIAQHSAQICTVNRAPNTQVHITSSQIDEAIRGVLEECCGSEQYCSGGQYAITADSGNVIDLSVQSLGQSCTA